MSRRTIAGFLLLAALAVFGGSCGGTSVGNPPGATTHVRLGIVGTTGPKPMSLDIGGGITIDEAWVSLKEIELRTEGTCSGGETGEYDAPLPVFAELVTGTVYPKPPAWDRPPGQAYCEFRAKIDVLENPAPHSPVELTGQTVFVTGTRSDGTPFRARTTAGERLTLGPQTGGFSLAAGNVGLLLAFDLSLWFDPLELDAATATGGVVLIDDENNKDVADALGVRVPESALLYRDGNLDGELNGNDGSNEIGE